MTVLIVPIINTLQLFFLPLRSDYLRSIKRGDGLVAVKVKRAEIKIPPCIEVHHPMNYQKMLFINSQL